MLTLHVLQGPDRGKTFQLPDNQPQLIGRSSEALPITDRSVSRRHAELTPDGRDWYLRDISSSNGTHLNGEPIHGRVKLSSGDQIRCGSSLFVFGRIPDAPISPIRVMGPEDIDATVERTITADRSAVDLIGFSQYQDDPKSKEDHDAAAGKHLRLLYDITSIIGTTVDRDELLNRVMDMIFEEARPDRGFILLQSEPNERPDPVVIRYRTRPRTQDEGHIPVSRTIVQHVLRKGEGILSSNAMNDDRFRAGDSVTRYGIRSAICVPMRSKDRIFGVIHVDSSVASATFTDEQLRLLSAIGMQTGLALETAERVGSRVETERLAAIGETVASLSHSIRNILQGLRGGADAVELALGRDNVELAREGWPIVARNLDRIYSLTMNMLAFSKTRQPDIELENLHALIGEAIELVQPHCATKRIALLQDFDDGMPPVPLDAGAVHQAIMNLLLNALDAVPERKGVITIRTRFDAGQQVATVILADNGKGVVAADRERIFEPFQSTKGQRGTGLGLAVARKIMQEHGGDVELLKPPADQPGASGAEFLMRFPLAGVRLDASATSAPRAASHLRDDHSDDGEEHQSAFAPRD
ncbi:MAG: ATP-binding protein [Phycisphaerales bacterium]